MSLRDFAIPRVLELTYTAWDLESFAADVGYDYVGKDYWPPFAERTPGWEAPKRDSPSPLGAE